MKLQVIIWCLFLTGIASADERIVGGEDAIPGKWPWLVELSHSNKPYEDQFCGGSLIKPDWVVTAAHCMEGENVNSFQVIANIYDLKKDTGQNIKIKRIISHPKYIGGDAADFDIALIQLKEPVKNAVTIPLITGNPNLTGINATVIGWGNMSSDGYNNFYPFKLQEVQIPIVSNQECRDVFEQHGDSPSIISANMLCAGLFTGGKDACQGDSGGPLMIQQGEKWVLTGIVSWGDGCALPFNYGVYSRVTRFTKFINANISIDYFAMADVNHNGIVDKSDKQAKFDELQTEMKNYVDQCWTPAASCGDLTGDDKADWRDLLKQSTAIDTKYQQWVNIIWTPEK